MRCDNILCSNDAEFFNVKTNQYKCQNCLGKYLDRHSPTWVKLEQEANDDFPLEAPKLKVKDKYSVVFSHFHKNGLFIAMMKATSLTAAKKKVRLKRFATL